MKITLTIEEGKEQLVLETIKNLIYITDITTDDKEGDI